MFYVMGIQFSYNFIPIVTEHAKINLFPCILWRSFLEMLFDESCVCKDKNTLIFYC